MKPNLIADKSERFAIRIVNLCAYLRKTHRENIISRQILRSGTSIGANVAESIYAQSDSDFVNKLSIARKEASETLYWIRLLNRTNYIDNVMAESLTGDCDEIIRILTSSILTKQENFKSKNDK